MKPGPTVLVTALLVACGSAIGAEPIQMRPLHIHGDWEVAGRYRVADKGLKFEGRERDSNEWVRITRGAIVVYRQGRAGPTESFDIKVRVLADERVGVIEMSEKNNREPTMTLFYRFEGSHLLLCVNENKDGKSTGGFAAPGSRILELVPYERNRLIVSRVRPIVRSDKEFQKVAPPVPPNPPPVADPKQ